MDVVFCALALLSLRLTIVEERMKNTTPKKSDGEKRRKKNVYNWNDSDESNRMIDLWSTWEWILHDSFLHSISLTLLGSLQSIHPYVQYTRHYAAIDFVSQRICVDGTQSRRIFAIFLWPRWPSLNGFEHNVWAANKNSWQKIVLRAY